MNRSKKSKFSRPLTLICTDQSCRGTLYCITTRMLGGESLRGSRIKTRQRIDYQVRERRWVCVECGKRYVSCEVLNPQFYSIKPAPKQIRERVGLE
jgi:hypothetical protein